MTKIKFTKGELKRQRDALRQYERYLPTLQLKKQQLQLEIVHQLHLGEQKRAEEQAQQKGIEEWAGLLSEAQSLLQSWLSQRTPRLGARNVAGVDIPVCEGVDFSIPQYDLFATAFWVDSAVEALKKFITTRQERSIIEQGIEILRQELRITTQRVNLFEKVKIPEAKEAIRLIKIYLGDQMSNAVGRSKIAKRKIETLEEAGVYA
jgi:V/A-type H+-transporting ATPase subunit D